MARWSEGKAKAKGHKSVRFISREMDVDKTIFDRSETQQTKSRKWFGYILFLLFGIGTWLNLNGIWIELPLLIPRLPEGWDLSAQLGMASNLANIGPLIIAFIRFLTNQSSSYEVPSICLIFLVGITVPIILSFTWFKQVYFLGQFRSMYLLIFGFCLALVNCTSSVTYLPFVNRFDEKWLNIYFAGESLSSLLPAMLGLLQGVGQKAECIPSPLDSSILMEKHYPARFSIQIYLICLSVMMFISFLSFLLLWKFQMKQKKKPLMEKVLSTDSNVDEPLQMLSINSDEKDLQNSNEIEKQKIKEKPNEKFTSEKLIYLSIIFWTSILLIGCIPSINSYSLNPYGAETFHYVIILCQCCYPLVSLISTIRPKYFKVSKIGIIISTISGTLAFIYIFITAYQSPCSPFVDEVFGKYLVAFLWILVYLIFYYERISIGNYLNQTSGHRGLFWYGLLTQAGAFIGASFIFLLTWCKVFKERELCVHYQC